MSSLKKNFKTTIFHYVFINTKDVRGGWKFLLYFKQCNKHKELRLKAGSFINLVADD